jgi:hypothetical protein
MRVPITRKFDAEERTSMHARDGHMSSTLEERANWHDARPLTSEGDGDTA